MAAADWVMMTAIVLGPLFGVWLARHLQERALSLGRRMDLFRVLMRTRRTQMLPEHVGALNLVEIEFARDRAVIDAWRDLFKHLGAEHPRRPEETPRLGAVHGEVAEHDGRYYRRLGDERQRLLAKLLHAMAKALGFKIEQLEIFEGGYVPKGWFDIDFQNNMIRRFATEVALGEKALPVLVFYPNPMPMAEQELQHPLGSPGVQQVAS